MNKIVKYKLYSPNANLWCILFALVIIQSACKKFIEIPPPINGLVSTTVYSNNTTASAAVSSIYDRMSSGGFATGFYSVSLESGLQADELVNYAISDPILSQFYTNALSQIQIYSWDEVYSYIYMTNTVLENLPNSNGVTDQVKQQLTGEAKFMRAFLYFYMVNLYGDVPLTTTTNYQVNNSIKRSTESEVYSQIVTDLEDAKSLLSAAYLAGDAQTVTADRVRPTKWAASALLARVYLYTKDWTDAEAEADTVINNSQTFSLDSLNGVFLKASPEAIWQLQPVETGYNTLEAQAFILTSDPGSGQASVSISQNLLNAFEPGDKRDSNWVGVFNDGATNYYYPLKYKVYIYGQPLTEYLVVMRLAEQYLIRAEAEVQLNDVADATVDLNLIRARAGLNGTTATTPSSLLTAIYHERQVEFFTEWGCRWFDLKRAGLLDALMGGSTGVCAQKGGAWSTDWSLVPIPKNDILINPNLTQNPGY